MRLPMSFVPPVVRDIFSNRRGGKKWQKASMWRMGHPLLSTIRSFPRKRESTLLSRVWVPALAGASGIELYVARHVLAASRAAFAFAVSARAKVDSHSSCNGSQTAFAVKAIFARHLAGPTADPIASNRHGTLAHAHGRSGTSRRDDPISGRAARSVPRRGAP